MYRPTDRSAPAWYGRLPTEIQSEYPCFIWRDSAEIRVRLGKGSFGTVYHGSAWAGPYSWWRVEYAEKVFHTIPSPGEEASLIREIIANYRLGRLKYIGISPEGIPVTRTLYAGESDLLNWFNRNKRSITLTESFKVLAQVAEQIQHLHSIGMLHGDIKPGNVVMSTWRRQPTVIDFGAVSSGRKTSGIVTSYPYIPIPQSASRAFFGDDYRDYLRHSFCKFLVKFQEREDFEESVLKLYSCNPPTPTDELIYSPYIDLFSLCATITELLILAHKRSHRSTVDAWINFMVEACNPDNPLTVEAIREALKNSADPMSSRTRIPEGFFARYETYRTGIPAYELGGPTAASAATTTDGHRAATIPSSSTDPLLGKRDRPNIDRTEAHNRCSSVALAFASAAGSALVLGGIIAGMTLLAIHLPAVAPIVFLGLTLAVIASCSVAASMQRPQPPGLSPA